MTQSDTDFAYAVPGGYIYFNESNGTITDADTSVTTAIETWLIEHEQSSFWR